jgi:hypothetical protein
VRDQTRLGSVVEFDEPSGLGAVVGPDGLRWPFHCVSIADGTRRIDVGERVVFSVEFRTLRREAVRLEKAAS